MSTGRSALDWLIVLVGALVGGIVFGTAGLYVGGFIGDMFTPNFGEDFAGIEAFFYGIVGGAAVGIVLGGWLAHRLTRRSR